MAFSVANAEAPMKGPPRIGRVHSAMTSFVDFFMPRGSRRDGRGATGYTRADAAHPPPRPPALPGRGDLRPSASTRAREPGLGGTPAEGRDRLGPRGLA